MKRVLLIACLFLANDLISQNLGIGTTTPLHKLDVNGNIKVNGLILNNGGAPFDFLMKLNETGLVSFKKGHGGMGLHYIICVDGTFPIPDANVYKEGPFLSEIKVFTGTFAPKGWMFCEGQNLLRTSYPSLFTLLQTTYGYSSPLHFALPDLRGAVPVGAGTSWTRGQKSN